jgi:3-oxoacyl-[acyl-carrier protein] reductase
MKLGGVRAIVTGANQGLGLAVAEAFVAGGARVFVCARDGGRLETAIAALRAKAARPDAVQGQPADISVPDDVTRVVDSALTAFGGLDALVCNAGVYGPMGAVDQIGWGDWVHAVNVNLCGSVFCCRAVLPHFRAQKRGKIILLSGGGATKATPFLSAYAASKAALVRFGETLAEEVRGDRIDVNSVAPGALNTRLLEEVLEAGPERVGEAFYKQSVAQKESGGVPLQTGAALCAFLASSASDGITGRLISAVWDPWQDLADRRDELARSDIYTLRRIVPEDRGKRWGEPS